MNKIKLSIFLLAIGIGIGKSTKAFAQDITVTCHQSGECDMAPSAGAALFDKSQEDNTKMLPGDTINRAILLINESKDNCAMYLKKVYNVHFGNKTPTDFASKMFTAMQTSNGTIFGSVSQGYPTNNKTLQDLFDVENLGLTKIPSGSQEKINWVVRFDPLTGNPYQKSEVWFDFDMVFECRPITASSFTISKYNSAWPTKLSLGNVVTYKIIVETTNSPIQNVNVIDAPAKNIIPIADSWTAQSSNRGDLKANGQAFPPVYSSPAIWAIGDMDANETVTLTYQATVGNSTTNGIYKDLAWAYGYEAKEKVLAASTDSGFAVNGGIVTNTFVGTQVLVDSLEDPTTKKVSIKTKEIEGEVLGATTQILPATGANTIFTAIIGVVTSAGILINLAQIKKQKAKAKVLVSSLLMAVLFGATKSPVFAQTSPESLFLRISEPKTPDNRSFVVDYVALDIQNNPIKITCLKKSPQETFFTPFLEVTTKAGGDSGVCAIDGNILSTEGIYTVKVTAEVNGTAKSEEVAVLYKKTGPQRPKYIEKEKVNNCEYEVTVKTSDDSKNAYIEIYRSAKKDFTVGASTRVKTMDVTANKTYEFTHKLYGGDCGSSYYAVRAFDSAGNPSDVRAEVVEEIIEVNSGSKTGNTASEASEILPGTGDGVFGEEVEEVEASIVTEGEQTMESENTDDNAEKKEEESQLPEVLGAKEQKRGLSWVIPVLLVVLVGFFVAKSNRGKSKSK
ncbi:hypothetical protein KBG31_02635 [Patescibacteria group bacterium]|nr:hypothetical protein [Patescibacteria group bacterium]